MLDSRMAKMKWLDADVDVDVNVDARKYTYLLWGHSYLYLYGLLTESDIPGIFQPLVSAS